MPKKRGSRGGSRSTAANGTESGSAGNSGSSGGAGTSGADNNAKLKNTEAALPGGAPGLSREQQVLQQQLFQHQLQLLRLSEQQRPAFPVAESIRAGFMFAVALVTMGIVFKDYGWMMTAALAAMLYMCGLFRFLSVIARWLFKTVDGVSYDDALRRADILPKPIVKKHTHAGENAALSYGCSCMQGWRRTMEDAHTMQTFDDGGLFAVYDGHNGASTSKFCGANLYRFVSETAAFKGGNYLKALYDGFIAIDQYLFTNHESESSGCTAVVLFVKGDELYCANAGDSRCVLCRDGEPFPLSTDHKPYLPTEQARIERAGGYVWGRRVHGILALSRAIGDFRFKQNTQVTWDQQAVTSAPEVRTTRLNRDKDEFAVVACDGIWDVMTNEQVVEFVRPRVQQRMPLGQICEQLLDSCLAPQPFSLGCDNMSVIIVQFKRMTQGGGAVPSSSGETLANASPPSGSPVTATENAATTVAPQEQPPKRQDPPSPLQAEKARAHTAAPHEWVPGNGESDSAMTAAEAAAPSDSAGPATGSPVLTPTPPPPPPPPTTTTTTTAFSGDAVFLKNTEAKACETDRRTESKSPHNTEEAMSCTMGGDSDGNEGAAFKVGTS